MSTGLGIETGLNGSGYQGFQSYQPASPIDLLPDYSEKFVSIIGRWANRIRLIPFLPDVFSVAYTESALVRAKGFRVFDEMLLDDQVVSSVASAVGNILTASRVEPADVTDASAHEKAIEVADFFNERHKEILDGNGKPGGLGARLHDVIWGGIVYGFAVAPPSLKIVQAGKWRGYTAIGRLPYLMPHFLEPVHEVQSGAVAGWAQIDRLANKVVYYNENEVLHYVIGGTKDPARGRSSLLAAHIHWVTKVLIMRLRNHNAEWSVGRIMFSHEKNENENGITKIDYDNFCKEWINAYIDRWGIPLPYGVKAQLLSSGTIGPDVYNEVLRHADQGIKRAIAGSGAWMLEEEPDYGTRAQSETTEKATGNKSDLSREHFTSLCQNVLIDWPSGINGWPREVRPKFTMEPAKEENRIESIKIYNECLQAGSISKQPQDENFVRTGIGAPLVKEQEGGAMLPDAMMRPDGQNAIDMLPTQIPAGVNLNSEDFSEGDTVAAALGRLQSRLARITLQYAGEDRFDWTTQERTPAGNSSGGRFGRSIGGMIAENDFAAGRPSLPGERHDVKMPYLQYEAPPLPEGKPGQKTPGGYTATGLTNTEMGDMAEASLKQLGLRSILPPGHRQNPLDVEFDHSGLAFEVKACSTASTSYKASPKSSDLVKKIEYAKAHGLRPATMVAVVDVKNKVVHAYWKEGIGRFRLNPRKGPQQGWKYAGTVKLQGLD